MTLYITIWLVAGFLSVIHIINGLDELESLEWGEVLASILFSWTGPSLIVFSLLLAIMEMSMNRIDDLHPVFNRRVFGKKK